MADIFEITGRIHSTSQEHVISPADEILDTSQNKKQHLINSDVARHESEINSPTNGLNKRVADIEALGQIGDTPVETNASNIISNTSLNGKVPSASAVNGIYNAVAANAGYYACDSEASTAAKVVEASGYVLTIGGCIKIKMTNANTADDDATLNINSTGAKALYYEGERASATNSWEEGETVEVYYDGTNFHANNVAGGSGSGDGAFDVSAKYPTSGVEGGNTYTLEGALTVLNANLSASKKKGGMSIKFIQSSDHKYVQYRLMADEFTTDVTQWSFCGDDVLVENPEWIYVLLDAEKRILAGIKADGSVEWSIGIPTPVKKYIDGAIAEIKNGTEGTDLDGLNKIIDFLSDFSTSDTLKELLDTKVDKEEGKSLVDAEYADGVHYIENPEFVYVKIDSKDKILWAIKTDGDIYYGAGVPQQVIDYIEEKIAELSLDEYEDIVTFLADYLGSDTTLKVLIDGINAAKVDKVEGKSLIDAEFAEGVSQIENPEFAEVHTGADDKVLYGVKQDGDFYFGAGVPSQVQKGLDNKAEVTEVVEIAANKVDKEEGKSLIDEEYASTKSTIESPEFLDVTFDAEDKIIEGIQKDGTKVIGGDLNVGGSAKILGNMEVAGVSYKVIENPEYLVAWLDAEDKIIFGFKTDGKTYVGDADFLNEIKNNQEAINEIKSYLSNFDSLDIDALTSITAVENPEFLEVTTDSEGKLLAGRTPDGAAFESIGFTTPKVSIDGTIEENIEDPEGRTEILTDDEGRIVSYRDGDGIKHETVGTVTESLTTNHLNLSTSGMTEFQQALINSGFNPKSVIDWSDQAYIHIPQKPTCAVINITGIDNMPQAKNVNSHAWMEVWDKNGNYFKKRVILNAQGRSSLQQTKKNFAADFCEDEWEGDDTTTIKIGKWVSQDSFHFKAYYTDMFKMANVISYKLWQDFKDTMPFTENKPYKEYFANNYTSTESGIDDFTQNSKDEAKCVPDGFPIVVYLNSTFYGLFVWQLKKHRDNYMLDRNSTSNIHLDGEDYTGMFNGIVNWTKLEIRNPKPKKSKWTLYCMDGSKYDGDNPKELIDDTSENWDGTNASHVKSAQTKANILAVSQYMSEISPFETAYNNASSEDKPAALEALKAEIEKRFGVKWMIDYVILINLERNGDSIIQNTQWITWGKLNGKMKWYPCPYDLDASFGIISTTSFNFISPIYVSIGATNTTPIRYVYAFYQEELKARWKELRDNKIIDKETFIRMLKEWIDDIGNDNLSMEYDKWSESPCNRDAAISNKWEITNDKYITYGSSNTWFEAGTYDANVIRKYNNRCYKSLQNNNRGHRPDNSPEWWEDITVKVGTYAVGDAIYDGYNNFYKFIAKESITVTEDANNNNRQDHLVNTPFAKLYTSYPNEGGVHDSLYRIYKWISEQIALMDSAYTYNV